MTKKLVFMVYADFTGGLDKINDEGAGRVRSILAPLKRVVGEDYFTFFSSLNRQTIDTALAIADGLGKRIVLRTRHSLYSDDWHLYHQFYTEAVARPEDCIVAIGHRTIVEEFPDFLKDRVGEGWEGERTGRRKCCQGYVYDIAAKTWKLFPEDFK